MHTFSRNLAQCPRIYPQRQSGGPGVIYLLDGRPHATLRAIFFELARDLTSLNLPTSFRPGLSYAGTTHIPKPARAGADYAGAIHSPYPAQRPSAPSVGPIGRCFSSSFSSLCCRQERYHISSQHIMSNATRTLLQCWMTDPNVTT